MKRVKSLLLKGKMVRAMQVRTEKSAVVRKLRSGNLTISKLRQQLVNPQKILYL